jgi:hypothetical protein
MTKVGPTVMAQWFGPFLVSQRFHELQWVCVFVEAAYLDGQECGLYKWPPIWMAKNAGSTSGHLFGWPRMRALPAATYLDGQECGLYKWPCCPKSQIWNEVFKRSDLKWSLQMRWLKVRVCKVVVVGDRKAMTGKERSCMLEFVRLCLVTQKSKYRGFAS